jgi:hypothetical protein
LGAIRTSLPPAKLVFGLLVVNDALREDCMRRIILEFGRVDHVSVLEPFSFTDYYREEMGESIWRQYLSIEPLIAMYDLTRIKRRTNEIELEMAVPNAQGRPRRRVNIDPGYLTPAKMVLATTKDYRHRIYVADGIFEEVTLHYRRPEGFAPYPWTYPDYARAGTCRFFNEVRETYMTQLRTAPTQSPAQSPTQRPDREGGSSNAEARP